MIEDETSNDCVYVNLLRNPERFTGYAGDPAHRIWRAIYQENCFGFTDTTVGKLEPEGCKEKRIFYKLVSGNINVFSLKLFF